MFEETYDTLLPLGIVKSQHNELEARLGDIIISPCPNPDVLVHEQHLDPLSHIKQEPNYEFSEDDHCSPIDTHLPHVSVSLQQEDSYCLLCVKQLALKDKLVNWNKSHINTFAKCLLPHEHRLRKQFNKHSFCYSCHNSMMKLHTTLLKLKSLRKIADKLQHQLSAHLIASKRCNTAHRTKSKIMRFREILSKTLHTTSEQFGSSFKRPKKFSAKNASVGPLIQDDIGSILKKKLVISIPRIDSKAWKAKDFSSNIDIQNVKFAENCHISVDSEIETTEERLETKCTYAKSEIGDDYTSVDVYERVYSENDDFEPGVRQRFRRKKRKKQRKDITKPDRVSCTYENCSMSYTSTKFMLLHVNRDHLGMENPFVCPLCGKGFPTSKSLSSHKIIHRLKDIICDKCGKGFKTGKSLQLHQKVHLEQRDTFKCEHCGGDYKSRYSLRVHVMTMHTKEYSHCCNICQEGFPSKTALTFHLMTHEEKNPLKCEDCGKISNNPYDFRLHRMIHTGDYDYRCSICKTGMQTKKGLKVHMEIHEGTKNFACNLCGKKFIRMASLNVHMKYHNNDRQFVCEICGKRFVTKWKMQQHVKSHSGEEPATCPRCHKIFPKRSSMKKHLRIHKRSNDIRAGLTLETSKAREVSINDKFTLTSRTEETQIIKPALDAKFPEFDPNTNSTNAEWPTQTQTVDWSQSQPHSYRPFYASSVSDSHNSVSSVAHQTKSYNDSLSKPHS